MNMVRASLLKQLPGRAITLILLASSLFISACEVTSTIKISQFPQLLIVADPLIANVESSLTITAKDSKGQLVTAYTGTVRISSTDPAAEIPASYTFSVKDAGTKKITVKFKTAGNQTITIYDTRSESKTSAKFTFLVNPGPPTEIVLSGFPTSTIAGVSHDLLLKLLDSVGNVASNYTGTFSFTSSDPIATLPADYTFTEADVGLHAFPIELKTVGNQSLAISDTGNVNLSAIQSDITVVPAPPENFLVAGYPTNTSVGTSSIVTITARDLFGNTLTSYPGTIHFSSSDPLAVLPADYTFLPGDLGEKSFNITLKTSGTHSITVTDTTYNYVDGSQTGIILAAGAASSLVLTGYAANTTAGASNGFTVAAKDIYGNTAVSYQGTVQFTSSDISAVLPSNYTFVPGDAGVKNFAATLRTSGTRSITVTDTITGSLTSSQTGISVASASAVSYTVSGYPSTTTAGVASNLTVTAKDTYGNTATSYVGTVALTSSDPAATLPSNYTFVSGDAGVKVLNVTLKTSGSRSITATDTVTGSITGSQSGIVVSAASASTIVVSGHAASITAGSSNTFTSSVRDVYGNVKTTYVGTVHFTSSDGAAVLPADYTYVAGDLGVRTFSATLKTSGTQSITVTDTVTGSITGSQTGITVTSAAAASLILAGYATTTAAGTSNSFSVTAKDTYGNTATDYLGTVNFTSSDPSAVLPTDYTFLAGDAGVKTFAATLKTSGSRSITATDTVTGSLTSSQTGITVTPIAAVSLTVSGYPSSTTAGVANNLTVTAKDTYGNTATSYLGTVAITSSDP
ncbi:MAG: hypothetical protein ABIQ95_12120, partial [Bdellovibrionia bacterium]